MLCLLKEIFFCQWKIRSILEISELQCTGVRTVSKLRVTLFRTSSSWTCTAYDRDLYIEFVASTWCHTFYLLWFTKQIKVLLQKPREHQKFFLSRSSKITLFLFSPPKMWFFSSIFWYWYPPTSPPPLAEPHSILHSIPSQTSTYSAFMSSGKIWHKINAERKSIYDF